MSSGGSDKPASACRVPILIDRVPILRHAIADGQVLKPETFNLDRDLRLFYRELSFRVHVFPGALVACLQIGIVEDLSAGTDDMLNVARDHPDLLSKARRPRQSE